MGHDESIRISPPLSKPRHITVFLSSPSDVADERALARRTLESLENQPFIRGRATLRVVAWDNPGAKTPLLANLSPQEAINRQLLRPGRCDVAVVILWSRLGTPLGEEYRKPNGEPYRSGTEWEFEDAVRSPSTSILMYRRTEAVRVDLDDPDYDDKRQQYEAVKQFFAERMRPGSAEGRGFVTYESPSEFEARFATDIRSVLEMMLERAPESEEVARAPVREAIWPGHPTRVSARWVSATHLCSSDAAPRRISCSLTSAPRQRIFLASSVRQVRASHRSSAPGCCRDSPTVRSLAADPGDPFGCRRARGIVTLS